MIEQTLATQPHPGYAFSEAEWLRYTRHIQLPNFGVGGQQKLKNAHVLLVGCGGLGCPSALYLAAAGVGRLTLLDSDCVELSNLQRQVAFRQAQIGESKARALANNLRTLNSAIDVVAVAEDFTQTNALALLDGVDIVLDCTDNFATRYLINDKCFAKKIPWVMASIAQFSGQCALFTPDSACFRCLFPAAPTAALNCAEGGVLGVLPGMLAMYQACEAIKYLTGLATPLNNHLLLVDALRVTQQKIALQRHDQCVCCGEAGERSLDTQRAASLAQSYARHCAAAGDMALSIDVGAFYTQIDSGIDIQLIDVRSHQETRVFAMTGPHFSRCQFLPLDDFDCWASDISPLKPTVMICQSGARSLRAAEQLHAQGHTKVQSLRGGLVALLKFLADGEDNRGSGN